MKINKEQFRDFELERLVFFGGGPEGTGGADAAAEEAEAAKAEAETQADPELDKAAETNAESKTKADKDVEEARRLGTEFCSTTDTLMEQLQLPDELMQPSIEFGVGEGFTPIGAPGMGATGFGVKIEGLSTPEAAEDVVEEAKTVDAATGLSLLSPEEQLAYADMFQTYIGDRLLNPNIPGNKEKFDTFVERSKALGNQLQAGEITAAQAVDEMIKIVQEIDPEGGHNFTSLTDSAYTTLVEEWKDKDPKRSESFADAHKKIVRPEGNTTSTPEATTEAAPEIDSEKVGKISSALHADFDMRLTILNIANPDMTGEQLGEQAREMSAEDFQKVVEGMPHLSGALSQIEVGEDGNVEMTKENKKKVSEALIQELDLGNLEPASSKEMGLLDDVKLEGMPRKLSKRLGEKAMSILSMNYEIKEGEEGQPPVLIDNEGNEIPLGKDSFDQIVSLLPEEVRTAYDKENPRNREAFDKAVDEYGKTAEQKLALKKMLENSAVEGSKMNFMDWIKTAMTLIQMASKALSGDETALEDFTDAMKQMKEGRPILESMQDAQKNYKDTIAGMAESPVPDLTTIFEIYNNPRGNAAKANFPEGSPFRTQLKGAIQDQMDTALGSRVNIASMDAPDEKGRSAVMTVTSRGRSFELRMDNERNFSIAEFGADGQLGPEASGSFDTMSEEAGGVTLEAALDTQIRSITEGIPEAGIAATTTDEQQTQTPQ